METAAEALVTALTIYLALGVVFALPFVFWGIQRIDPAAEGGTWGFRLLTVPASAALWPLLLARLLRGGSPPEESTAHRRLSHQEAGHSDERGATS